MTRDQLVEFLTSSCEPNEPVVAFIVTRTDVEGFMVPEGYGGPLTDDEWYSVQQAVEGEIESVIDFGGFVSEAILNTMLDLRGEPEWA